MFKGYEDIAGRLEVLNDLLQNINNRTNCSSENILEFKNHLNETFLIVSNKNESNINIYDQNKEFKKNNLGVVIQMDEVWGHIIHIKLALLHIFVMSLFTIKDFEQKDNIINLLRDLYLETIPFAPCSNQGLPIVISILFKKYPALISSIIVDKLALIHSRSDFLYSAHGLPQSNIFRNRNHNLEKIAQTFNQVIPNIVQKLEITDSERENFNEIFPEYVKYPENYEFYNYIINDLIELFTLCFNYINKNTETLK